MFLRLRSDPSVVALVTECAEDRALAQAQQPASGVRQELEKFDCFREPQRFSSRIAKLLRQLQGPSWTFVFVANVSTRRHSQRSGAERLCLGANSEEK